MIGLTLMLVCGVCIGWWLHGVVVSRRLARELLERMTEAAGGRVETWSAYGRNSQMCPHCNILQGPYRQHGADCPRRHDDVEQLAPPANQEVSDWLSHIR